MPAAPTTPPTLALADLPAHRCATIAAMDLEPAAIDRLAGLGVCVGRAVELVQRGDPVIVRACGARIGLARELARGVRVHACEHTCPTPPTPYADTPPEP